MFLSVEELVLAVDGRILCKGNIKSVKKTVTDSRIADENSLFVPLKGEKFDGHDFFDDVYEKGCRVFLSSRDVTIPDSTVIMVSDTRIALAKIAEYWILKVNPKKIAITGSVGKTTTKDMIACVCSYIDKTLKTEGNFNNDIGVPLTAFRLNDEKIAIFEMGMNHFGEIDYLSKIVHPEIAVITNIGHSHIENLGSQEGILKSKMEIINGMKDKGTLVLNGDDPLLFSVKDSCNMNIVYYGIDNPLCQVKACDIKEEADSSSFLVDGVLYKVPVPGKHNIYNALSAVCVGKLLGGSKEQIKEGLLSFKPEGIRQNIINKDGCTYIVDCYNAAPDSMLASLDVLRKTGGGRKIAVFGSVLELGSMRDELLYKVGMKIKEYGVDELITVTADALSINEGAKDSGFSNQKNFENNSAVLEYLKENIRENDVILIKGSRKYKMEEISQGLLDVKC